MNIVIGLIYLLSCVVIMDWINQVYNSDIEDKNWISFFMGIQIFEFVMRALMEFSK